MFDDLLRGIEVETDYFVETQFARRFSIFDVSVHNGSKLNFEIFCKNLLQTVEKRVSISTIPHQYVSYRSVSDPRYETDSQFSLQNSITQATFSFL